MSTWVIITLAWGVVALGALLFIRGATKPSKAQESIPTTESENVHAI